MRIEPTTSQFYSHTSCPCATTGLLSYFLSPDIKRYLKYAKNKSYISIKGLNVTEKPIWRLNCAERSFVDILRRLFPLGRRYSYICIKLMVVNII